MSFIHLQLLCLAFTFELIFLFSGVFLFALHSIPFFLPLDEQTFLTLSPSFPLLSWLWSFLIQIYSVTTTKFFTCILNHSCFFFFLVMTEVIQDLHPLKQQAFAYFPSLAVTTENWNQSPRHQLSFPRLLIPRGIPGTPTDSWDVGFVGAFASQFCFTYSGGISHVQNDTFTHSL